MVKDCTGGNDIQYSDMVLNAASINAPAGPEFKREFPVVENMVRFDLELNQ